MNRFFAVLFRKRNKWLKIQTKWTGKRLIFIIMK